MKKYIIILLMFCAAQTSAQTTTMINGTGTVNRVPKFTGTNKIGNSQIVDNGKVGINTTTPSTTLDVNGTGKFADTLTITTMSMLDSSKRAASTAFVKRKLANISLQNVTNVDNETTNDIVRFNQLPYKRTSAILTADSNSGILRLQKTEGVGLPVNNTADIRMDNLNDNTVYQLPPISGTIALVDDVNTATQWNKIGTNIFNKNNGNIGMFTSTPTAKLHLNGTFRLSDGTQGAGKYLSSDAAGNTSWANLPSGVITNPTIDFLPKKGIGNTFVDSKISESGVNVGVNNLFPAYTLDIFGTTRTRGFIMPGGNTGDVFTQNVNGLAEWQPSNSGWSLNGNANTDPQINYIGTTDAQPLRFKIYAKNSGLIDIENTAIGYRCIDINSGTSNTAFGTLTLSGTTGSYNTAVGSTSLNQNFGDYNTALGISSLAGNTGNNNIGIGTASLENNINNDNIGIGAYTNTQNISNSTVIGNYSYATKDNSIILGSIARVNGAKLTTNVGIGTTGPESNLHVVGDFKLQNGSEGIGKVLTSDNRGNTKWLIPAASDDFVAKSKFQILTYTATTGQQNFLTPYQITSTTNLLVYRNGVNIDFTIFNENVISLFTTMVAGDKIKIYQQF